jgi:hypothetical protein
MSPSARRFARHDAEMVAASGRGLVTDLGALMAVEHAAMLVSMLAAMLLRRDQYTTHAPARVAA